LVDLRETLDEINPAELDYTEWVQCGMALKHEGYDCGVWDSWSSRDHARYRDGECVKKWNGFHGGGTPVTGGTIVKIAQEHGWAPPQFESRALDWDDEINYEKGIIDPNWVEDREVRAPNGDWNPTRELITYLELLFSPAEYVGYVTRCFEKGGKKLPATGNFGRTAGQLIEGLRKCNGDVGAVLGDYNPDAGAWIRFNPFDEKGIKNENVTNYRFCLVESDKADIDRQNAILRQLELPIVCLVHSGNKSLHAIVRVDAGAYDEYRKRVDYIYGVCKKNGLEIDTQNRNPSRLSRMPGVTRNGQKQYLVDTNIGKATFEEWCDWYESETDDLPEPEDLSALWDDLPDLSPSLVDGILRMGHKMLLAGPSKAGKSFALIELVIAIAEGRDWLGWTCKKGKVLYVNLELDRASCLHRFKGVYAALGWEPDNIKNIHIWNLRGKSCPMDQLAPKLIRRAAKQSYVAIVIDPIYKVITGDENSADQMARFCNQFDKVCTELGCAVIYCHHHSKGAQGGKRSIDRSSGSGVFGRDPDALLDMIELEATEDIMKHQSDRAFCEAACAALRPLAADYDDEVSQDDELSRAAISKAAERLLKPEQYRELMRVAEVAADNAMRKTAWRIEGTLREFPGFPPKNMWFDYPVHCVDDSGALADIDADGVTPPWQKGKDKRKKQAESIRKNKSTELEDAYINSNFGEPPTLIQLKEYLSCSERSARDRVQKSDKFYYDKNSGTVLRKNDE